MVIAEAKAVRIVECPRDAWQGLPKVIPAEVKAEYLRILIAAGLTHLDAASFVSRTAVPQMADSEAVLELLDPPEEVEIIGIVVNAKGAERAAATAAVQTLGFPYSISPEFLRRNQRQTPEESLAELEAVGEIAFRENMRLTAYVSMAFGNPYGDPWSVAEVVEACELLRDSGIHEVSLADTVGAADADTVGSVVMAVLEAHADLELGVHLHARTQSAGEKIAAAYEAGCRRFDSAMGGLGGCPFAQDSLVGNLATEQLLATLAELGAQLPDIAPLDALTAASADIARRYGAQVQ